MGPNRFYYKQNRLKQLRAFCHTAETGSISKAAERLFLSQPSVSLQIKALEREMDISLFERRGSSIELTPQGKILYELSLPLVEGIDALPESFAVHCGSLESGELNIAAGESTILYILPEVMKKFNAAYPGIRLRLHNVTGRDGMALLRANDIDFAVGSLIDVPHDIAYHAIFSYDPMLITPLEHPLLKKTSFTLEDIASYGLILPPRHLSTWRMVKMIFQQHHLDYKVTLEAGGWEVIKKYVELGLGISIVTSICLANHENLGILPLSHYFPKRDYGLVLRRGKFLSASAKKFIEMMAPDFFKQLDEKNNSL